MPFYNIKLTVETVRKDVTIGYVYLGSGRYDLAVAVDSKGKLRWATVEGGDVEGRPALSINEVRRLLRDKHVELDMDGTLKGKTAQEQQAIKKLLTELSRSAAA